jgi:hypothetical protein
MTDCSAKSQRQSKTPVMSFKLLNTITAGGSLINSLFYLLAPAFSLSLMGTASNPIGLMNTRVAGACALGMCVVSWTSRNITEQHFQRIISVANFFMLSLLVVIELHGTLTGALNWVGWLFIAADGLLSICYGRLLLRFYGS